MFSPLACRRRQALRKMSKNNEQQKNEQQEIMFSDTNVTKTLQ